MSDRPKQIPQVEQPDQSADDAVEQEQQELDKQARSAAYRDVHTREQLTSALNRRIDVLQSKLDQREGDLHRALPRVSELEHAATTSKIQTIVEGVGAGGGSLMLAIASFSAEGAWPKPYLIGAGIVATALAIFGKALVTFFGWPKAKVSGE